ncbi:helix-turn-helix domain-containing protein [Rhizobium sp. SL86]|uniref:helix-turn-helix domain-containing protein n=1 Tax=Rhizobium sp. SL86 TaxID=2995148 RepID=UPI0022738DFD|nr:helix-turn-helix domain-containing protein [Rhizobium sp. SL86]MCY1668061.1 helix-turn-helix domain-containing protein [Rhizobium sp. SL86]
MSKAIAWTSKRILCEIHERGMTLEQLALRNGRNPSSFRNIWTRPNSINEGIIAEFIGIRPEVLWPKRYPKTTTRIYDSLKYGPLESQKSNSASDMQVAA